jgi:hypothetical protein
MKTFIDIVSSQPESVIYCPDACPIKELEKDAASSPVSFSVQCALSCVVGRISLLALISSMACTHTNQKRLFGVSLSLAYQLS